MSLNSARLNRFLNQFLRPASEKIRDAQVLCTAGVLAEYQQLIADGVLPAADAGSTDVIDDDRTSEGVNPLTVADVHGIVGSINDLLGVQTTEGMGRISKACVRPPTVLS